MTDHPSRETLSAYVDARLPPSGSARVAEHLVECDECRGFVRRSRALMTELRDLQREIRPPGDLERPWLDETRRRPPGWSRPVVAAAAVVLLAAATFVLVGEPWADGSTIADRPGVDVSAEASGAAPPPGTVPPPGASLADIPADPGASVLRYERAVEQLTAVYRTRRDELPAEVVRAVDAGLTSLDRAIRRTSEVAGRHPDAPLVRDMLVSRYERKLELLRRTLDLTG